MPERLELGRERRPNSPEDGWIGQRLWRKWRKRHAAKKRRIAAMSRRRRIFRKIGVIATWLLGVLAVFVVAAVVLFYTLSDVPQPGTLPLPQVATIEYSDGSTMASIGTINRTLVSLDKVPKPVQWDILAAEDRGFYSEPGVSVTGTLRAAFNDLTGGDTQGGSGITQQYVKNAYLNNSRTLSRKLKELAIAVKLSRQYSKDQILEFYLNTVYFGRNSYGIQAGAHAFFGVDVGKLDVAQGAVLAAGLRSPAYYDPSVNPAQAKDRWHYVLDGMVSTGHLTQAQADAMTYPKVLKPSNDSHLGVSGPKQLIVQRVLAELQTKGISEDDVYTRGLKIRTTIDPKAQKAAEAAISSTFSNLTDQQKNMKNALVAVNPQTGGVLAYYGGPYGKNYAGATDYYDYASLGSASPGSSFKPYTLATALTETLADKFPGGPLTISSIVDGSQCVTIEGTRICNDPSDAPYSSSQISVASAMKYSLNTTFDQLAQRVGPENVAKTAHAMGISKEINGKPTLVNSHGETTFGIGIGDFPVHPIDQAVGFGTLANGGVTRPPYFVDKATSSDGQVIYEHTGSVQRSIDAKVANDVTRVLEPVASWSGVPLDGGRISAAKTGTEGIEGDANKGNSDAWMVGYTPQVSAAVWVGSGDSTHGIVSSSGRPEYGRDLPGRAWKAFMDAFLAGQPNKPMATKQLIYGPDGTPAPSTASATAPPPSSSSSSSSSPKPTFSISTGFSSSSSSASSSRKPPPTTSSSSTPTSSPPTSPTKCNGVLGLGCPSS
jgi:membrane peptidoglycan carboxypeptidase